MNVVDSISAVAAMAGKWVVFVSRVVSKLGGLITSIFSLLASCLGFIANALLIVLGIVVIYGVWFYVRHHGGLKASPIDTTASTQQACFTADLAVHDVVAVPKDVIKKEVLPNGLTILVCQQRRAPKVLVQIGYNVGSAIETAGERGLAHLLEHMIFKGTEKLAEGDIDAIARKYGADFNAFTSNDMTSYFFETDSQNWRPFLSILADCMQNARFSDQHLASEVKAVIQELRMYKDSNFHAMLEHAFTTIFPANHPYHFPIIGYKEDLADISGARLKAFYDKYYHPSRAVLCIVGDVDIEEALQQARDAFGAITCNASDHEPAFVTLQNNLVATSAVMHKEVQSEYVGLYWRIPGLRDGVGIVASAVEYMLGGGLDSRLYRRIVDELQIATSVRVNAEVMQSGGLFLVTAEPKPGKLEECKKVIADELRAVITDGFDDIELYKMVKNRQRQHMLALYNLHDFVYQWLESYFVTSDEYAFFNQANDYAVVTPEQAREFVAQWLQPRDAHSILIAPLPEESRGIWMSEQKKVEDYYGYLLDRHKRIEPLGEPVFVDQLPPARPLQFAFPQPTRVARQLASGLTVISHTDRSLPIVSLALVFKDAAYIARALEGVGVDMMMALLVEGAKGLSKKQIVELFDLYGAQYSYNGRGMSLLVGASSFSTVSAHAFSVLLKPDFKQEMFEKMREIFVHSYKQKKDSAKQVAMRALKQAIYYKHPYGWSFDDALAYLEKLTLADIKNLHAQYVTPTNMVLSVAGDIEAAFIEECSIQMCHEWPASYHVAPVYPAAATPPVMQALIPMLRDQVVLALGRPSGVSLYEPAHITLDLLSHICFNSLGSRLYELREQTGLFYTASGAFGADIHQEFGYDYLCAIVSPEHMEHAQEALLKLLGTMLEHPFEEDELAAARQMYAKEMIDAAADVRSLASLFANIEILGIGQDYYDKALRYVYELPLEELNRYAREYISQDHFFTVAVGRVTPSLGLEASQYEPSADETSFEDHES